MSDTVRHQRFDTSGIAPHDSVGYSRTKVAPLPLEPMERPTRAFWVSAESLEAGKLAEVHAADLADAESPSYPLNAANLPDPRLGAAVVAAALDIFRRPCGHVSPPMSTHR